MDVEDYFMVSAFSDVVRYEEWDSYPSRVAGNTRRILELLGRSGVTATFFVLGWIAERQGGLVKEIRACGHEIASHGYKHDLIFAHSRETFRRDVRSSKDILEQLIGERVLGYRAPSYSITKNSLWAIDILAEEGFLYDSSIFPIHHDRYGLAGFHRFPTRIRIDEAGTLLEIPPSTIRILGMNLPFGGGGYFRLYPLGLTAWCIRRVNETAKHPAILYIHPWEIDGAQPRIRGRATSRWRHYVNIESTERKLERILSRFDFTSIRDYYFLGEGKTAVEPEYESDDGKSQSQHGRRA